MAQPVRHNMNHPNPVKETDVHPNKKLLNGRRRKAAPAVYSAAFTVPQGDNDYPEARIQVDRNVVAQEQRGYVNSRPINSSASESQERATTSQRAEGDCICHRMQDEALESLPGLTKYARCADQSNCMPGNMNDYRRAKLQRHSEWNERRV